ncbi:MAG: hypothetical protein LC112_13985 [Flavobacteriales bacterium]|nr:hypothetical protein [Flavobacteriales bacterium]
MITINNQPATNKLVAAYRPILIDTTITGNPPVTYCDVYILGQFYKTISKTQPPFVFDIQDAVQEYIQKVLPVNGGSSILNNVLHQTYCKIRSSQLDPNGFIQPDGPVPVQATGTNPPIAGGGTQTNTFFVVNAVLQHEDNQDLEVHLNSFKQGTWANNMYPLSHRLNGYKICKNDSDYFPVVNIGNTISCLRLYHRPKGSNIFSATTNCNPGCVPVSFSYNDPFPNANAGQPYSYSINLLGTSPFIFNGTTMPPWLNANITGNVLTFSGNAPGTPIVQDVEFEVTNCGGSVQGVVTTIQTVVLSCGITLSGISIFVDYIIVGGNYVYEVLWTNNGGTPSSVQLEYSIDGGVTWLPVGNFTQTSTTSANYSVNSTVDTSHILRLTPFCSPGNPGAQVTSTYTAATSCPIPILTSVSFDANNNIILTWNNNASWVAMTVQYSYDTINWNNSTGGPNSPRNFGSSLNNTGIVYFRLQGECAGQPSGPSNSIAFDTTIVSGGNIDFNVGSIAGSEIVDVTPAFYLLNMGSFPVQNGQTVTGQHGGYNGDIYVQASGADPNNTLELFINGSFSQALYVGPNSGIFTFVNVNINANDNVLIRLINF